MENTHEASFYLYGADEGDRTLVPSLGRRPVSICMERMKGIEPSYQAWEARILPLNYTRMLWYLLSISNTRALCKEIRAENMIKSQARPPSCYCFVTVSPLLYS